MFSTGQGTVSSLLIPQMCQQKEGLHVNILSVTIFKVFVSMRQVLCEATMPKASGGHGIAPSTWSPLMLTQCLDHVQCSSEGLGMDLFIGSILFHPYRSDTSSKPPSITAQLMSE